MEAYRISIQHTDGSFAILDKTFSQTCEMLKGADNAIRNQFWDKQPIIISTGETVKFVKEV